LAPRVRGAENSPPLDAIWAEEDTPGIGDEPTYLRSGVLLSLHDPASLDNPGWTYTARYDWYHAAAPVAFGRLTVDLRHDVNVPGAGGVVLLHGRGTFSHTGGNSVVPFYLQETLGGTNIRGNSTVRGLFDYRYRGPHTVLLQAEYRRQMWDPLGITIFYDTGTVATPDGTISANALQHSYGVGVTVSIPTTVILRLYIARAGNNWHPFVGIMDGF